MVKHLAYGERKLRLADDEDLTALCDRVSGLLKEGGGWLEVGDDRETTRVLLTPGIPIAITESAPPPSPVAFGVR